MRMNFLAAPENRINLPRVKFAWAFRPIDRKVRQ